MDCRDTEKFVHVYLDGEFAEGDRVEFERHLRGCEQCRRMAAFERRFKQQLRGSLARPTLPEGLRDRVLGSLEGQPVAASRARTWTYRVAGIAAALVLALGLGTYLAEDSGLMSWHGSPRAAGQPPAAPIAGAAAMASLPGAIAAKTRSAPTKTATPRVDTVAANPTAVPARPRARPWLRPFPPASLTPAFAPEPAPSRTVRAAGVALELTGPRRTPRVRERLTLPIPTPRFAPNIALVDAKRSYYNRREAVQLVYSWAGRHFSVLIFPRSRHQFRGMRRSRIGDTNVYFSRGSHGHNVAAFHHGPVGYTITSNLQPRLLGQLVRAVVYRR